MPPRVRVEISDEEFERCLETVVEMWGKKRDTVDIACVCQITEAQAEYILMCARDGTIDCKNDIIDALREQLGANWVDVLLDGKTQST